jgi:hypothetical protein
MTDFNLLSKLADAGVLGIVLALSIVGNVLLYKEIKSLQEKRVEDAKAVRDLILEPIDKLQQTTNTILTMLNLLSGGKKI